MTTLNGSPVEHCLLGTDAPRAAHGGLHGAGTRSRLSGWGRG